MVVTTGISLAESSVKIDADLMLTPDRELSNEKQIVIKVADQAKTQRDLSLIIPNGTTFDATATEKLNQEPTYTVDFDSKDKPNQITLKALVKKQVENKKVEAIKSSETSESSVSPEAMPTSTLQPTDKKAYLLVFKIKDIKVLVKQQLKLATVLEGKHYESKPLIFKEFITLEDAVAAQSAKNASKAPDLVKDTTSLKEKLPVAPLKSNSVLETPSIDDPGEQDGWVQTDKNIMIPINIDKTANESNREYFMYFGGYYTGSTNPNGSSNWGAGQYEVPIGSTTKQNVPDAAFFQLLTKTKAGKIFSAVFEKGTNSATQSGNEFGETGLSLLTANTDFVDFKTYNSRRTDNVKVNALGTDAPKHTFPIYKLMYKKDSAHPGLRAYAMTNGADGQPEGMLRVTLEPINQKGRIRAQIRYISLDKTPRLMAWSYSMHMDLDGLHESTPTYSLGGTTGLYTYAAQTPSDKSPFKLTYWKDGYPDDPEYEMVNYELDYKYFGNQWGQYSGGGDPMLSPGWEITGTNKDTTDPGKYQLYKGHGYNHPVWHFKWEYREVQPKERYQVNLDFGLSSDVDYNNVEATKSYENLTSKDGYNRVGDRMKFKLLGRNTEWDTNLTDIMIIDVIPKDFIVDTGTLKLVDSTGKEQVLSPSVYNPKTGLLKVNVPGSIGFNESVYITFETNIAPTASGKTVTNSMNISTDKASKHDSSDVQVKVEKTQVLLQKQVKNLTTPDESYVTETKGKSGDDLSYQIHVVNVSTDLEISSGTDIEDVLDPALTSDGIVTIDYFDVNGTVVRQETSQFDDSGHLKLAYAIPKAGHVTLTFTANITDSSQEVINNSASATYGDGESTQSNNTVVNLPKPIIPIMQKDVRNVTNDDAEFIKETTGAIGEEVEYRVQVMNPSTEESIPKETMFSDQLDEDLVNDTPVTVEYYSVLGTKTATQEVYFQNGKFKLNHEIEPNGHIMVYFKAEISKTTKAVINNTATLADGKSDVAKINIIKKMSPTVIKEVKNLTKNDDGFAPETEAEVDDQVEYRIQLVNISSVDTKAGTILKDVLDSDLGDIQQVKIDYLDKDENVIATQTANLIDDQVTLDRILPAAGQGMAIAYVKAKVKETDKSVINNKASLTTEFGKGTSDNAKLNIKQSKGRIVVRYRDRKDESHKLAEDETFDGKIGDTKLVQPKVIPETDGNWTVVDSSNMADPDWGSTTKPDWTLAHDYTVTYAKDEQVITYRYEESHIGIIADKRWDFGQHDTTATDRNYYLKAKTQNNEKQPYEVGVEDYYTSKGWTLNVKQDDQFHTNANEKIGGSQKFLDNAVLNFHNGQIALKESDDIGSTAPVSKLTSEFELAPKGAAVNLMTHTNKTPDPGYYAAHGFGIWAYQFGDAQQADYSIGLKVPKATKRFPRQYTSQLTWSLVIAE